MSKKVNGKRKGNSFEREVCSLFEDLFGGTFKRVPQSGAFGTINHAVLNEAMKDTLTGDIICPKTFPFSVEAKSYRDILWHHIVQNRCKVLDKWIEQSERDACTAGKEAMVVFKIVRQGVYVVIDADTIDEHITKLPDSFIKYQDKIILSWEVFKSVYNGRKYG